ncbi:DVUA0089 family protein [Treponema primitia]|uniref:DVUA0089 family protein n=1 Tax=Treponema primitia TaxID=88058 RepID=UPI0039800248
MLKKAALLVTILMLCVLTACVSTPDDSLHDQDDKREISPDSYEPDSRNSPVKVKQDEWISRALHANDSDWFSFTPETAGLLVAETDGDTDTVLELYQDRTLLRENDDVGNNINAKIEYFVNSGVNYLIKASGVRLAEATENATGLYRFRVTLEPMPTGKASANNTLEQAERINMGETITAYFLNNDDIHWYTTSAEGAGRIRVNTEGTLDTLLEVYDKWEELIGRDDDSGYQGNAKVVADILSAGPVYFKVSAYQGATGRYYLRTQFRAPIKPDPYENDNNLVGAKEIQPGASQARNFTDAGDIDWVRLQITQEGNYEILAKAEDNYLDTYIELFDADGELIAKDDDSGGFWNALLKVDLSPGTYYIKVSTVDKDPLETNDYTLSVSSGN